MAKTKTQLISSVETRTGRTDKDTLIGEAIDSALLECQNEHFFREMYTTADLSASASDVSEALPSDMHQLLEVRLIDGTSSYSIFVKSKRWVVENFPNISADNASKPDWCYEEEGTLYFSCPLDDAYTIRITYYAFLVFASAATANPIPCTDNALLYYAMSELYESLELDRLADKWLRRGDRALVKAVRSDKRRVAQVKQLEEFTGHRKETLTSDYFVVPDSV